MMHGLRPHSRPIWDWGWAARIFTGPRMWSQCAKIENQPRGARVTSWEWQSHPLSLEINTIQRVLTSLLAKPSLLNSFQGPTCTLLPLYLPEPMCPAPTVPVTLCTLVIASSGWRTRQACSCLNTFIGMAFWACHMLPRGLRGSVPPLRISFLLWHLPWSHYLQLGLPPPRRLISVFWFLLHWIYLHVTWYIFHFLKFFIGHLTLQGC